MVHSDPDNGPQIRPQRLSTDWIRKFWTKGAGGCSRILIPFGEELMKEGMLSSAIEAAQLTSAELILLSVRSPAAVKKVVPNHECLFTALKGLQAQLQSYHVHVRFDSVTGPAAASIVAYARNNRVDLIVIAGKQGDAEAGDDVAQAVLIAAQCPTVIVQEN